MSIQRHKASRALARAVERARWEEAEAAHLSQSVQATAEANPELKLHEILFQAQTAKSKARGVVLRVKLRASEHASSMEAAGKVG